MNIYPMLKEIETELPVMKWMWSEEHRAEHFTGVGPRWTVQLILTGDGQQMAAASSVAAMTVMKLPETLTMKVASVAREWFATEEDRKRKI